VEPFLVGASNVRKKTEVRFDRKRKRRRRKIRREKKKNHNRLQFVATNR
jgi:hypothetical protein